MAKRQFSTHISNPETIDALHDGVPEWMRNSLDDWIKRRLSDPAYALYLNMADIGFIHKLERRLRADLMNGASSREALRILFGRIDQDQNLKLDVVDGILQLSGTAYSGTTDLELILLESGSKWRVAETEPGNFCLEERVDATTTEAMGDMVDRGGDVAQYLTKAWNETFGRSPNPSVAYSNAIKAVEAAAWPVVIPKNNKATLGTIIQAMKDKPENFQVHITEKTPNTGVESTRNQMSLIWEGQTDRHGTANPVAPTQEAAEQALFIAISLSQQFTRSLIRHL